MKSRLVTSLLRSSNSESILQASIGSKAVIKRDEWQRIHAEQDARDRNILVGILVIIAALALVSSLM